MEGNGGGRNSMMKPSVHPVENLLRENKSVINSGETVID